MHKMMRISAGNGEDSSSTSLVLNNSDLLINILLCLPVESLLVLKHVSKEWYSLISDSYFMQKHYALHYNKLSVSGLYFLRKNSPTKEHHIFPSYDMLLLDQAKTSSINVSFVIQVNEKPVGLYIDQSCNGLLLCHRSGTRYIYNPSTRHYRMIPQPPLFLQENPYLGYNSFSQFYLVFSPRKSLRYEIVFLRRIGYVNLSKHEMAVYSSNTGSWIFCGYVELGFKLLCCRCVTWNGCLNWMEDGTLFYFNISQQVLKKSSLSNEMLRKYRCNRDYFGESMGHMYLILRDKAWPSYWVGVFEMEIDYSGWKPICRVGLGGLENQYGKGRFISFVYSIFKLVAERDGDEDELKVLIIHLPGSGKILSYDFKINSFKEICDYQTVNREQPAYIYIGSLANV